MRIPQQVSDRVKEAPAHALRAVFAGIGQVLLVADRMRSRAAEANRTRSAPEAQPARPAPNGAPAADQTAADQTRWRSLDKTGNVRLLSDDDFPEDDVVTAAAEEAAAEPTADLLTAAEPAAEEPAPGPATSEQPLVTEQPLANYEPLAAEEPLATYEPAATQEPQLAEPVAAQEPQLAEPVAAQEPQLAEPVAAEPAAAEPAGSAHAAAVAETVLPVPNYDGLTVASLRARLRNLDPPQLRVLIDYEKAHAGRADVVTMFERRIIKLEDGEA